MKQNDPPKNKKRLDYLWILIGTTIYALGVHLFTAPNQIAPGGVTGLATAIFSLTGIPIGLFVTLINIPLLLIGWKFLGSEFVKKTLVSTIVFTLLTDVVFRPIPVYQSNTLVAALFGGVMIGTGMALNFIRNGSTGGTDITGRLIQKRFPYLPIGKIILLSDCVIITFAAFVFRELETALYAIIAMFSCSKVLDSIIYGLDIGKMVMIVSDQCDQIAQAIAEDLSRGSTLLSAKGTYSGAERRVLLCALRHHEFYRIKQTVNRLDPKAFIIVTSAGEILGEGFKKLSE